MGSEFGTDLTLKLKNKVNDQIPFSADPPSTPITTAKADSGASSHYFRTADAHALSNLSPTPYGPTVMLPDNKVIQATHKGLLPFHHSLSTKSKTAHVVDGITNSSLISIGQLCDDNCIAVLDKKHLQVFKNKECILKGTRNKTDGLWDIALPLPATLSPPAKSTETVNAIIRRDISKTQLVQYLYGCLGSPAVSTWQYSVKNGNFITWPGLENLSIRAHLPDGIDSARGHLNQERKKSTIDEKRFAEE